MTERIIPTRIEPLSDGIESGGPHLAATDLDLIKGAQALARRSSGNRMSLTWHAPEITTQAYTATKTEAPYADLTDATTWTSFSIDDPSAAAPLSVPWYVAEGHDYPSVMPRCVSDLRYLSFELRVQKTTFVQATSSETFYAPKSDMAFFGVSMSDWVYGVWTGGRPAWFQPLIECKGISLPSSPRDVLLTPQVRISQRGPSGISDVAGTHRVYLSQLLIFDSWDE